MPNGGSLTLRCSNSVPETSDVLRRIEGAIGEFVCVAIADSGHGMSAEVRKRALQPFFTTKKVGDGSGLGLATVEGFCGQSGGHLWIESKENIGTTIHMFLPRCRTDFGADEVSAYTADSLPFGNGEHVLVVEDNEDVRILTTTMLNGLNYQTTWTSTADAALELLRSGSRFDLVLVDVRLPGQLNGLELAEFLRRDFRGIRTAVYSGYPEVDDRFSDQIEFPFLRKPFSRRELALVIAAALNR